LINFQKSSHEPMAGLFNSFLGCSDKNPTTAKHMIYDYISMLNIHVLPFIM